MKGELVGMLRARLMPVGSVDRNVSREIDKGSRAWQDFLIGCV